jgi:hypothetical protein
MMDFRQTLCDVNVLATMALAVAFCGCRTGESTSSLVGRWECTDLAIVEHVSQFAKSTTIFQVDGQYATFLTDHGGNETSHQRGRYRIEGDRVLLDEGIQSYRFTIKGNELTLRVDRSQNEEDTGKRLHFHRAKP